MRGRIALVTLLVAGPAAAARVEGVVLGERGPLAGASVSAYASFADLQPGAAAAVSRAGERPGTYELDLPAGSYFFVARGQLDGTARFGFHGGNPVSVSGKPLWLPIVTVAAREPTAQPASMAVLRGTVTFKGTPVSGAQVSLYSPFGPSFRGLGLVTTSTGTDGRFELTPSPGDFVVMARKRLDGAVARPLHKGDLFCYVAANPVSVRPARALEVEIPCYPKDDIEAFLDAGSSPKRSRRELVHYRDRGAISGAPVSGRVVDIAGNPRAGLLVMAYDTKGAGGFQMYDVRDKPVGLAETDAAGTFALTLASAGPYVLVAREHAGVSPTKGEYYGLYEGNVGHAVSVPARGKSADIVVSPVLVDTPGPLATQSTVAEASSLTDTVIAQSTLWRGVVDVTGVVVVGRRATLAIAPGTTVRFRRVDRNNDGIGDGELRVLGRLVAKGTTEAPIRFTSAEPEPRAGDWSYVLLFTSAAESELTHVVIEHAFSGLQAHFAAARLEDSELRENREGLRFGRAQLAIRHNSIHHNHYGIRHHRLEGPVEIAHNDIRDNDVGIFLVPSGQNTIDFSPVAYSASGEVHGQPLVHANNIQRNRDYDYRVGERVRGSIALTDNFWGQAECARVGATIFDGEDDPTLGRVVLAPCLAAAVHDAGPRRVGP